MSFIRKLFGLEKVYCSSEIDTIGLARLFFVALVIEILLFGC